MQVHVKAAVLHALGQPPRYEDFADPQAIEGEVLVRIKAASLKNVDKMMAAGSHYDRPLISRACAALTGWPP
jgi:NADPH2:quinone reductase